jgi:perosamine synthetase
MPVHIYGQAADMDKITELAKNYGLWVIEDAAEAIGVTFKGRPVGNLGDIGCISFYADKTATTGEGGMILTNDDELAEWCTLFENQGRSSGGSYIHPFIGYNFRLSDLQAAVGLAQLSKLPAIIERKQRNESVYRENLTGVKGIEFPYTDPRGYNVPFRINILVQDPEELRSFLEKEGIGSRRFFYPLHRQPCCNLRGEFPNADRAYERGLPLPSSPTLSEEQISYVCEKIKMFMEG